MFHQVKWMVHLLLYLDSINHLQIGGGDYDELGGVGPHNVIAYFFGETSDFGFTIQQVQGDRSSRY